MPNQSFDSILLDKLSFEAQYRKGLRDFMRGVAKEMRSKVRSGPDVRRMSAEQLSRELARRNSVFESDVYKFFLKLDSSEYKARAKERLREQKEYVAEAKDMLKYLQPDVPVEQALQATGKYLKRYSKMYSNIYTQSASEKARALSALSASGGAMVYKGWMSKVDGLERPAHLMAHSLYGMAPIPINVPFTVGGDRLMFPGDRALGAKADNTMSCRCMSTYTNASGEQIGGGL